MRLPCSRLAAAALCVVALNGCFHAGVGPRRGDVLGAGEVAGGAQITVAGYAPGKFGSEGGNTAQRGPMSPMLILGFFIYNVQGFLRVGATDRVELEATLGYQEISFGSRIGLVQEEMGDGVSAALSAAAYFRPALYGNDPMFTANGFGARAGLDLSRQASDGVALVWNPHVSFGPEAHAIGAPRDEECRGFGGDGCGEYGPGAYAYALRRELRLLSPLGVAFTTETIETTVGVVPHYTLHSTTLDAFCLACATPAAGPLDEDWGAHLVVRIEAVPASD